MGIDMDMDMGMDMDTQRPRYRHRHVHVKKIELQHPYFFVAYVSTFRSPQALFCGTLSFSFLHSEVQYSDDKVKEACLQNITTPRKEDVKSCLND
jgi:hypothetical protein